MDRPSSAAPGIAVGAVWRSVRGDRWLAAGLLVFPALGVLLALDLSPGQRLALLRWGASIVLSLLIVVAFWRPRSGSPAERRFWRGLAWSWIVWLAGVVASSLHHLTGLVPEGLVSLLGASAYLVYMGVLEGRPDRPRAAPVEALERLLSWPAAAVFTLGVVGYFVWVPEVAGSQGLETGDFSLLLPMAFEVYLGFRLLQLWLGSPTPRWRLSYALLAASALGFAISDLGWSLLVPAGASSFGSGADVVWLLPYLPAFVVGRLRLASLGSDEAEEVEPEPLVTPREQLLAVILVLPALHAVGYAVGLLEPSFRPLRDLGIAFWLVGLGSVAVLELRLLDRRARDLVTESVRARQQARAESQRLELVTAWRSARERYETIFRANPEAIVVTSSPEGRLLDVNPGFEALTGFTRAEVLGRTSVGLGLVPKAVVAAAWREFERTGTLRNYPYPVRTKAGVERMTLLSAEQVEIDGQPCALSIARDVTDLNRAQEARERSERRFEKSFFANPTPAVVTTLADGTILEANEAFCQLSGYSRAELVGRTGHDLGLWPQAHGDRMRRLHREGGELRDEELTVRSRAGKRLEALVSTALVEMGGERCVLSVAQDVTERKQLQAQLLRAQRMESIGTLAGGMAHDLNNVLTPLLMSIDLLRQPGIEDPEGLLDVMETSARRGADLIRQMLTFARGVEGDRVEVPVRHLVRELEALLRDTFPPSIELVLDVDRELEAVVGDPTQIHQVLLNLCINARDAMEGRGRLTIRGRNRRLDEAFCQKYPRLAPGPHVVLEVEDTGRGLSQEVREQIFDPFFTTKAPGQGTGLGLFVASSIVASHEGVLEVESEVGEGATFRVLLPAASHEESGKLAVVESGPSTGRGELVLVVDDELPVRQTVTRVLGVFGYRTELASGGREALARLEELDGAVDVALVDVAMPDLDGLATRAELRRRAPDLPVVLMSGLGSEGVSPAGAEPFLGKPFRAETLVEAVETALSARRQARGGGADGEVGR